MSGTPVIFNVAYTPYKLKKGSTEKEIKAHAEKRAYYDFTGDTNYLRYMTTEGKLTGNESKKFTMLDYLQKSTGVFNGDGMISNLWLLDDKFMTYSYAASDETVDAIKADIEEKNEEKFKDKNRPDITIFFNSQGAQKNVVVIEFKGANASKYEKKKALTELPDDVAIIKKHIPNITTIWSYIITSIDDEFKFSIENQEGYIELFTAESASRSYYKYFSKQNAHEFILDLKAITSDAFARNKVFMDILKKQ